jgi:predicted CopG family antitoxin
MRIRIPDDVYKRLTREASRAGITVSDLIRVRLESSGSPKAHPLLRVAGICRGPQLSNRIDDEIYYQS